MKESEYDQFGKMLAFMGEAYGKEISAGLVKIYWLALKQFELGEIERAITHIVSKHKYNTLPLPAHFIEAIHPPEERDLRVLSAIKVFEETVRVKGCYSSVIFLDDALTQTIEQFGGWLKLCYQIGDMTDRDYSFFLKEFERIYRLFIDRDCGMPRILLGQFDRDNIASGYKKEINVLPYCPDGTVVKTESAWLLPDGRTIQFERLLEEFLSHQSAI